MFIVIEPNRSFTNGARTYAQAISKIGRRWVTRASKERFDPATMELDEGDFGDPGLVFLTAKDRDDHLERVRLWDLLQAHLSANYRPPDNLEVTALAQALDLLRIRRRVDGPST